MYGKRQGSNTAKVSISNEVRPALIFEHPEKVISYQCFLPIFKTWTSIINQFNDCLSLLMAGNAFEVKDSIVSLFLLCHWPWGLPLLPPPADLPQVPTAFSPCFNIYQQEIVLSESLGMHFLDPAMTFNVLTIIQNIAKNILFVSNIP